MAHLILAMTHEIPREWTTKFPEFILLTFIFRKLYLLESVNVNAMVHLVHVQV